MFMTTRGIVHIVIFLIVCTYSFLPRKGVSQGVSSGHWLSFSMAVNMNKRSSLKGELGFRDTHFSYAKPLLGVSYRHKLNKKHKLILGYRSASKLLAGSLISRQDRLNIDLIRQKKIGKKVKLKLRLRNQIKRSVFRQELGPVRVDGASRLLTSLSYQALKRSQFSGSMEYSISTESLLVERLRIGLLYGLDLSNKQSFSAGVYYQKDRVNETKIFLQVEYEMDLIHTLKKLRDDRD